MTTIVLAPRVPSRPALPPGTSTRSARRAGARVPGGQVRLPRLLAGAGDLRQGLEGHELRYGPMPPLGRVRGQADPATGRLGRLIDLVDASGLTGRGGAGFPAGRKMRSVAVGPGSKAVVANGAEGEPASLKDRLLLTRLPHLVLDGITLAAEAVGASEAYLCVHGTQGSLLESLQAAVVDRRAADLDPVPIEVVGLPHRYVSSEQSAIVQYLNGGPAVPTFSPPRPHERGVHGNPTLVHNVETLAHLALIARFGDRWFRRAGLPSAPGTMLVTVSGAVRHPGVYEIEMGTPAGQVVMLADGPSEPLQALLIGGYFGAWLPVTAAWPVPMTHAGLKAAGGALGAGIVVALPASSCPVAETARVVRYLAQETAGQCGPCVFGLPALADALAQLAFSGGPGSRSGSLRGDRARGIAEVTTLIGLIERRGACRHPDGATQLVRSLLNAFPADVLRHEYHGPCDGVGRSPLLPLPDDEERDWDFR
jgi:NADH:ubiquinone oxidoreductase subunit F (NADH-binding)